MSRTIKIRHAELKEATAGAMVLRNLAKQRVQANECTDIQRKEERMEATSSNKIKVNGEGSANKKRSWGSAVFTFLASGGIILVLVVGVVITIVISILLR